MPNSAVASGASFELAVTSLYSTPLPAVGDPFASSSACVKVCVAQQVVITSSPGSSVVAGQFASSLSLSSLSAIPVNVTLPSLATWYP